MASVNYTTVGAVVVMFVLAAVVVSVARSRMTVGLTLICGVASPENGARERDRHTSCAFICAISNSTGVPYSTSHGAACARPIRASTR